MDSKLEKYRTRKRRQAIINNFKERFFNMVSFQQVRTATDQKGEHVIIQESDDNNTENENKTNEIIDGKQNLLSETRPAAACSSVQWQELSEDEVDSNASVISSDEQSTPKSYLVYLTYVLYFAFWATCYAIAIEIKFGTVYFLFSALIGIYLNTRTGPKLENEISAYSVFNKDCKNIDGALTAADFEREIRYGAASMRHN